LLPVSIVTDKNGGRPSLGGAAVAKISRDNIVFGSREAEDEFNRRFGGASGGGNGGGPGCGVAVLVVLALAVIGGIIWWVLK